MEKDRRINIRLSAKEYDLLVRYCKQESRSQSDVIRELIRKLDVSNKNGIA
ncbi:MAG TPA: CopG family transcriptional regulator [Cyanobacteria bacterium UBA11372]|nr:CopG family transcriptional regulator [Cyanobacteria bacterium UBA11372]